MFWNHYDGVFYSNSCFEPSSTWGAHAADPPKKSKIIVRHKSFFAIPRFLKLGGMISQNGSWLKMRDADLSSFIFRGLTVFVLLSSNMFFATWAGGLPNVRVRGSSSCTELLPETHPWPFFSHAET